MAALGQRLVFVREKGRRNEEVEDGGGGGGRWWRWEGVTGVDEGVTEDRGQFVVGVLAAVIGVG